MIVTTPRMARAEVCYRNLKDRYTLRNAHKIYVIIKAEVDEDVLQAFKG